MLHSLNQNNQLLCDVGHVSIIGSREEQQDTVMFETKQASLLAAICDGMGGLHNGKKASLTACEALRTLYIQKKTSEPFPIFLLRAVDVLDESVFSLRQHSTDGSAGTTLVAVAIEENNLFWLSVGDSRLYIIRRDEVVCVTSDHNYNLILEPSFRAGKLSETQYRLEKQKGEALISYIGMGGIELIDANSEPFKLSGNDIIILMSDGLYKHISEADILTVTRQCINAQEMARLLISTSQRNAVHGQDNASAIVLKMIGDKKDEIS